MCYFNSLKIHFCFLSNKTQVGSQGASILPVLHEAVGEWGAHTLRNVTYLARDLTHEGGGHQHLNKAFNTSNNNNSSHPNRINNSVETNIFARAAAGDEVKVLDPTSPQHMKHSHEYYDLSFLSLLDEDDKVSFIAGYVVLRTKFVYLLNACL